MLKPFFYVFFCLNATFKKIFQEADRRIDLQNLGSFVFQTKILVLYYNIVWVKIIFENYFEMSALKILIIALVFL